MLRVFIGNLIFAIIARMLCRNDLKQGLYMGNAWNSCGSDNFFAIGWNQTKVDEQMKIPTWFACVTVSLASHN